MWLGLAQSRNTPYVPFYGNVEDTYEAFKNRSTKYDGKSWYWTVWHIDQMVMKYPEIFGNSIQEKWKEKEAEWDKEQTERDAKYANYTDEQAKAAGPEVTKEALERSEKIFKEIKAVEAEMEEKIKKEKGQDADLVYTGYNKANLLADAKKGKEKDKAKESDTKKENSETKKSDSNQYGLWIVIALVVVVGGFIAFKQFSNKKED